MPYARYGEILKEDDRKGCGDMRFWNAAEVLLLVLVLGFVIGFAVKCLYHNGSKNYFFVFTHSFIATLLIISLSPFYLPWYAYKHRKEFIRQIVDTTLDEDKRIVISKKHKRQLVNFLLTQIKPTNFVFLGWHIALDLMHNLDKVGLSAIKITSQMIAKKKPQRKRRVYDYVVRPSALSIYQKYAPRMALPAL